MGQVLAGPLLWTEWLCTPQIMEFQEQEDEFFQFPQPKTSHAKPSTLGMTLYPPLDESESGSINQTPTTCSQCWLSSAGGKTLKVSADDLLVVPKVPNHWSLGAAADVSFHGYHYPKCRFHHLWWQENINSSGISSHLAIFLWVMTLPKGKNNSGVSYL